MGEKQARNRRLHKTPSSCLNLVPDQNFKWLPACFEMTYVHRIHLIFCLAMSKCICICVWYIMSSFTSSYSQMICCILVALIYNWLNTISQKYPKILNALNTKGQNHGSKPLKSKKEGSSKVYYVFYKCFFFFHALKSMSQYGLSSFVFTIINLTR